MHYRQLAPLARCHYASRIVGIVGDMCIIVGVQYSLKVVWFVHYCKLCITGNWLHLLGVIMHHVLLVLLVICASLLCAVCFTSWCGLCIIVSCALQATGSTCSVASARRGGSGVTRREYAPPPDHLSYKEFSKEKNAECLHFRFSICKEFSTVHKVTIYSSMSLSLSFALCMSMSACLLLCLKMVVLTVKSEFAKSNKKSVIFNAICGLGWDGWDGCDWLS